ncbi:hypothetical protein Tco_1562825 [Tanacetum coccineum]
MAYLRLHFTRNQKELKSNTLYPEDSISRIEDYLKILEDIERGSYSKKPPIRRLTSLLSFDYRLRFGSGSRLKWDDPNITMEEYIRLEEEKARRRGKVYNWETATYGKIWYDEDTTSDSLKLNS